MKTIELYDIAENNDVEVLDFDLPSTKSLSVMDDDFDCYIGIDENNIESSAELRTRLAHELGHCVLGAFYNRYSRGDLICKHEYKANKWACNQLIPKSDLIEAMKQGYIEVWQLAEYFDVTEELIKKAFWIYFDKEV